MRENYLKTIFRLHLQNVTNKIVIAKLFLATSQKALPMDYGHPERVFFFENPKLLGLDRQIGPIILGTIGVFSANLSFWYCELLVHSPVVIMSFDVSF